MAKTPAISEERLALYERLVATNPHIERKGAAMPYTSVNGHMFSFLTREGKLALRLPPQERDAFLKRYGAQLCRQHGTILQEYVEVPDSLFKRLAKLKTFFDQSFAYVRGLKPKSTKRPPAAAKSSTAKGPAKKRSAKKR